MVTATEPARTLRPTRVPPTTTLVLIGVAMLQLVWIFAVPPFRGIDEFDHSYRAAAVARGQWVAPPTSATRGTGAWLEVPRDLVDAARPECSELVYTTKADCVGRSHDGVFEAASGAGRYEPVFYAVIGTVALPFNGATAVYVMRFTAAALFLLMMALALRCTRRWAVGPWPVRAIVVATTPVVLYSSVVPGPNGLEIMAGLTLWSALLGLALTDGEHDRLLVPVAALSGFMLAGLRQLGPLWCVLILLAVLVAVPLSRDVVHRVLVRSKGWFAVLAVAAGALANVLWTASMASLNLGDRTTDDPISASDKLTVLLTQMPLWVLQSIAAFPLRDQSTHPAVYLSFLVLGSWLLWLGLRWGSPRIRLAILLTTLASILVPAALSYMTLDEFGTVWQGRYTIPFSVGVLVLLGLALDRRMVPLRTDFVVFGGLFYIAGQAIGPVMVALDERDISPSVANGQWLLVPIAVLVVVAVVGAAAMWAGAFRPTAPSSATGP